MTDWAALAYGDLVTRRGGARAYVVVNMVASVDGAISVDGRTADLGGPDDHHLFHYLRSLADVILVGAETVRAERYGPPRIREEYQAARAARGQTPRPRIVVVTRSLRIDPSSRLFTDGHRPVILAPVDADPERVAALEEVAEVLLLGEGGVDLRAAIDWLGPGLVLCEGGPTLNGELVLDDLVDELCLTVSPTFVGAGGAGAGILGPGPLPASLGLELASLRRRGSELFLRYRRDDRSATEPLAEPVVDEFEEVVADLEVPMMIVTVAAGGERAGCLVGFGSQAGIAPGRFAVWLSKANHTHRVARVADALAVHFPSTDDCTLAELFGGTTGDEADKFASCEWSDGPEGAPILTGITRWFVGTVVDRMDTGDHEVFLLAPTAGRAEPWPGQLGYQAVGDIEVGHPARAGDDDG